MNRWVKAIGLVSAIALLTSACSLIEIDAEKDAKTVVAVVNGEEVYKGEVLEQYNSYNSYYNFEDGTEESNDLKAEVLDAVVKQKLTSQYLKNEKAVDKLTDEERAEAEATADETINNATGYTSLLAKYEEEAKEDPSIDPEAKAREEADKMIQEQYGITREQAYEEQYLEQARLKILDELGEAAEVTDEEVQAEYDKLLESQKEEFTSDPTKFYNQLKQAQSATSSTSDPVVYQVSGYVNVKHVLISMDDETKDAITTLRNEGKDEEADAKREEGLAVIKAKADEVLKKAQDGEDFDKLIEEYGEDPGMKANVVKDEGYIVGKDTGYMAEFEEGALSMENVGDITMVATDYGYHVMQLVKVYEEGPVEMNDETRASLEAAIRSTKATAEWNTILAEYERNAEIKTYPKRL